MAVYGNQAYVMDNYAGLHVFDVSNPAEPGLLGILNLPYHSYTVQVVGDYVFMANGETGLKVALVHCGETSGVGNGPKGPKSPPLSQNFPNPFNPSTTIAFELPERATVNLRVFDISGRLVRVLMENESVPEGRSAVAWYGRDDSGRRMASGIYFYRLQAGDHVETNRMMLVK